MNRNLLLFSITFLFLITSCSGYWGSAPQRVRHALQSAGDNREELVKVLEYYQNDSLKYLAACFLIENMTAHFYNCGQVMECYKQKLATLPAFPLRDSLELLAEDALALYPNSRVIKTYDIESIESAFLIENIDKAFDAWQATPWHATVNFELFCKYILPYRVGNEQPVMHWRDSLVQQYGKYIEGVTDVKKAFTLLQNRVNEDMRLWSSKYPYLLDVLTIRKARHSTCEQRCIVLGSVMRALGIPVAYDCVESWANYSSNGHSWISLIGGNGESYTLCEGDSIPRMGNWIDSSFFKPLIWPDSTYDYSVDSLKRAVKVYRKNYFREEGHEHTITDISAQFELTDSVVITTDSKEKYAYLCTFKTGDSWKPVLKAEIVNGRCTFRNIGTSIAYLPVVMKNKEMEDIGVPFILHKGGVVEEMKPSELKQTLHLNRKYILMANWSNRWFELIGGRFEGSNDKHFCKKELLHCITRWPVYRNEIIISNPKAYRYVRYLSPNVSKSAWAELSFYSGNRELKGTVIGEGLSSPSQGRAFDHDLMTIADPQLQDYWVGLDLGKPCLVDKLVAYPRNDDNFIVPGQHYELFYYDKNTWHSLGLAKAETEELIYEDVPQHAFYWLRNRTKGREERIFVYKNGKQVWY